jgi:hypothetical protein
MRNKSIYFAFTVILLFAALFVTRQRALNELRAENIALQKKIDAAKNESQTETAAPTAVSAPGLGDADERELLHLRSVIVPLREQLRDASNQVVTFQRAQSGKTNAGH